MAKSVRAEEGGFLLLNSQLGWRTATVDNISGAQGPALQLQPHPQGPLSLGWAGGSLGGLVLPRGLALDRHGNILLLVPDERVIKLFDPASATFQPLPGIGAASLPDPAGQAGGRPPGDRALL